MIGPSDEELAVAAGVFVPAIIGRLMRAWPGAIAISGSELGYALSRPDLPLFVAEMQLLSDLGFLQYESSDVGGQHDARFLSVSLTRKGCHLANYLLLPASERGLPGRPPPRIA